MRILVLHSAIGAEARPDDLDTLAAAGAVAEALMQNGHVAVQAPFVADPAALAAQAEGFDLVFNLVESVMGQDDLAAIAPAMLERLGVPYTGCSAAANLLTADKPATKRLLRAAGLATPDWCEAPHWAGLEEETRYIVKAACADASIGLDDDAVVTGAAAVKARATASAQRFGGRWFAEAYVEGREFNVAVLETEEGPRLLPLAEMRFTEWQRDKPAIVGYAAKWDAHDEAGARMVRTFGAERDEPALAQALQQISLACWTAFGLSGYARVDFRIDEKGRPLILELNANPCLSPDAGFAAAAAEAGMDYRALIEAVAKAARHG